MAALKSVPQCCILCTRASHACILKQQVWGADQDDDCSFLDSVRYLLVGCTPAEESQALQIARQGGAARIQSLLPLLTHIIVSHPALLSAMQHH